MGLIFSRQCEYALQAVLFLALRPSGETTSTKELTQRLKIPYHFLGKILQSLVYKGLLISHKGPSGGFALAMPAKDITLFHIVEAIDGTDLIEKCALGFPECGGENPCPVHDKWGDLRDGIYQMLVNKTIEQMAKESTKPEYKMPKRA